MTQGTSGSRSTTKVNDEAGTKSNKGSASMKRLKLNIAIILIINGLIISVFSSPVFADRQFVGKPSHKQSHNSNRQHLKKGNSTAFRNKQRQSVKQTKKHLNHNKSWKKDRKHKKITKASNKPNRHKQTHFKNQSNKHKKIRHSKNQNHNGHKYRDHNDHNYRSHNDHKYRSHNDHKYRNHNDHNNRNHNYFGGHRQHHRALWYNTHYVAPIQLLFHPLGHVINTLPYRYSRIHVGGLPYFYYSGIFYKRFGSNFVVVSAPIGARIRTLPAGFIGFTIGLSTYYTINDNYYTWDEPSGNYLVVDEPVGASETIAEITHGRLIIEPLDRQDEKQQAKDRYACHRWAVSESNVDPTDEDQKITDKENHRYKQAISACLEDRSYSVRET